MAPMVVYVGSMWRHWLKLFFLISNFKNIVICILHFILNFQLTAEVISNFMICSSVYYPTTITNSHLPIVYQVTQPPLSPWGICSLYWLQSGEYRSSGPAARQLPFGQANAACKNRHPHKELYARNKFRICERQFYVKKYYTTTRLPSRVGCRCPMFIA